jgi:hypothetical protein
MPHEGIVAILKSKFSNTTITTAHKKYCNIFFRQKYGVPMHLLSTSVSRENYSKTNFEQKDNLFLLSPDNQELNAQLISYFNVTMPNLKFVVINGISYEEYKILITKSKFLLTSGEGLDNYFVETYFSGGIAFAYKNHDFFDEKYLNLPCLFEYQTNIAELLHEKINYYNNSNTYLCLNNDLCKLLEEDYSYRNYKHNLKKFYKREYSYA